MLRTSVRLAIRALGRNALRTILTMLGMIICVAAVMTMVALGNGAQDTVEQEVRSAGTNLIHVNAGNYTRGGEESRIATGLGSATTLTPADADAIGTDVAVAPMFGWRFDEGRFFSAGDVAARRAAVVVGRTTRDQIFGAGARVV